MNYSKDMELFGKMGMFIRRTQREMWRNCPPIAHCPQNLPFRHAGGGVCPPQNLPFRHGEGEAFHPQNLPFRHGEGGPELRDLPHGVRRPPLSREHLLVLISGHPEGIRQKALAEQAGINQSSASEVINKLEDDGYIERTADASDKRATLLFLTEKGRARAAEVQDEREAMFRDVFSKLTDGEKQTLSDLMDKLLQ